MSDQPQNHRPLSEIGHLFLSSVREKQTGGAARPTRIPPGGVRPDVSIDMTPDEFATLQAGAHEDAIPNVPVAQPVTMLTAVIGSHLPQGKIDPARELARRMSAQHGRVGFIEVDASEFRLTCFDSADYARGDEPGTVSASIESFEPRRMIEAIEELSWDVHHWLLVLPNPRTPEARDLLRHIDQWTLLATADHDGVVACYRMLKGLADLGRPSLSLALVDADPYQAEKVHAKLQGVCKQFLGWDVKRLPTLRVGAFAQVAEHQVMCCRSTRDKAQLASGTPWQVVGEFISRLRQQLPVASQNVDELELASHDAELSSPDTSDAQSPSHLADVVVPTRETPVMDEIKSTASAPSVTQEPQGEFPRVPVDIAGAALQNPQRVDAIKPEPATVEPAFSGMRLHPVDTTPEVIELPGSEASAPSIINAILHQSGGELVECPVKAPACPDARLAVTRDRQLLLLAVTRSGLSDLQAVSRAYQWMTENRQLIAMAVPQLNINAHALPRLRLLVDHADASADLLQPLLQSSTVTLHTYRRLKWGGRTGLLVEAA